MAEHQQRRLDLGEVVRQFSKLRAVAVYVLRYGCPLSQ